jgi:hypothetical protein
MLIVCELAPDVLSGLEVAWFSLFEELAFTSSGVYCRRGWLPSPVGSMLLISEDILNECSK